MGVYIKGMKMPTSCYLCPVRNQSYCGDGMKCSATGETKSWHDGQFQRGDRCPLVPVPSHGRLGDLDALITTFCEWGTRLERGRKLVITMSEAKQAIVDIIEDAPTIIPEEEDK